MSTNGPSRVALVPTALLAVVLPYPLVTYRYCGPQGKGDPAGPRATGTQVSPTRSGGMEQVVIDDLDPDVPGHGVERHRLSDPLGTTDVAINRYRIAPGEAFPAGLHAHADQEEVFVVCEGEATFDVLEPGNETEPANDRPSGGEVVVREGEGVRFAPGEFQSGRNASTAELVVLALGAPRESDDVRLPVACPACDGGEMRLETEGDVELVCPACGTGRTPAPCSDCGGEDLRVALGRRAGEASRTDGRDGPVVACRDCGATFETPPFRD